MRPEAVALLVSARTKRGRMSIGALDGANTFVDDERYIFTNLNTMGWVLIVLWVIQLTGGFSRLAGNTYGRVIGIIGGSHSSRPPSPWFKRGSFLSRSGPI
jgi:hypothetical protein